jgi:hypothetical protein
MTVEAIEKLGGADDVDVSVAGRFLEGLARPGFRRKVDHDVGGDVRQDGVPSCSIGYIGDDEFGFRVQIGGPLTGGMDLRVQVVDDNYPVEGVDQGWGDGAADETSAAGDEDGTAWADRIS